VASFISLFSAAQLDVLNERVKLVEKQASSATGTVVQGDNIGEFYLDDPNALFRTNEVTSGDIVEFSAGPVLSVLPPAQTLAEYNVAGPYLDPRVPAQDQVQEETRLILDGYPTAGGPVTYRVLEPTLILEDFAGITRNRSFFENVRNPELQALDDLFMVFVNKFDVINNLVSDLVVLMNGKDRTRITTTLLNNSALGTIFTELYPRDYFSLQPNRSTVAGAPTGLIDVFQGASGGEEAINQAMRVEDPLIILPPPLSGTYTGLVNSMDANLDAQVAVINSILAEIADNDTVGEAGFLQAYYVALNNIPPYLNDILTSIADQKQDLVDILAAGLPREDGGISGSLNFGTYNLIDTEIATHVGNLTSAAFEQFLDLRYPYLDLVSNRAFGTRSEIISNNQTITFEEERKQTLLAERITDRELLQLP
jgi:hypothetical protein